MVVDRVAPWAEAVLFTADDLARLPDDGWQYELVEGRLVRMPPPGASHGRLCSRINGLLDRFVEEQGLGVVLSNDSGFELDLPGDAETVLAPDAAFISINTMSPETVEAEEGYLYLAPDLVVEVASPSQNRPELAAKAGRWIDAGTRLVWILWPSRRQVDIWEPGARDARTLDIADELDGGTVLPGFRIPVARLWSTGSRQRV